MLCVLLFLSGSHRPRLAPVNIIAICRTNALCFFIMIIIAPYIIDLPWATVASESTSCPVQLPPCVNIYITLMLLNSHSSLSGMGMCVAFNKGEKYRSLIYMEHFKAMMESQQHFHCVSWESTFSISSIYSFLFFLPFMISFRDISRISLPQRYQVMQEWYPAYLMEPSYLCHQSTTPRIAVASFLSLNM